jgi:cyclophilin family peptidyl-prolyl cis-trans isomerase
VPKQQQRRKKEARRARQAHGTRVAAEAATRRQRRAARVGVALVAVLGILFLGVLGSVVEQEVETERPTSTSTTAAPEPTAPAEKAGNEPAPPPPCPEPDGSSPRRTVFNAAPEGCIEPDMQYRARFVTTAGTFVADLDPQRSPLAVNNFVFLARHHFYDGMPFHRVVEGFYAQTGDPVSPDQAGPGYTFDDDPLPQRGEYQVGSLVMAHERADENGSQFLIWLGPQVAELDPVFPLFGQVTEGVDVLGEISADGGTAEDPEPATTHRIERVEIIETR